ncbi:hypothetical protein QTP88_022117 [Uroleucon formosanum]
MAQICVQIEYKTYIERIFYFYFPTSLVTVARRDKVFTDLAAVVVKSALSFEHMPPPSPAGAYY